MCSAEILFMQTHFWAMECAEIGWMLSRTNWLWFLLCNSCRIRRHWKPSWGMQNWRSITKWWKEQKDWKTLCSAIAIWWSKKDKSISLRLKELWRAYGKWKQSLEREVVIISSASHNYWGFRKGTVKSGKEGIFSLYFFSLLRLKLFYFLYIY